MQQQPSTSSLQTGVAATMPTADAAMAATSPDSRQPGSNAALTSALLSALPAQQGAVAAQQSQTQTSAQAQSAALQHQMLQQQMLQQMQGTHGQQSAYMQQYYAA